jgi:hypothetical protein
MSDPSGIPPDLNALSKEQLVETLQGLQELLRSPSAKDAFVNRVAGKTIPQGNRNAMPYYKPRFARMVQITIDKMLEDKKNRVFRYEDFKYNTESTLYNKIYQGFLYLVDNLDSNLKYAKARDDITIFKGKDGIRLEIIDVCLEKELSVPIDEGPVNKREWKAKLQDFIDNSQENQKLQIKNVSLTKEEMEECEMMLAGLEQSFISRISGTEILVLHITPEENESNQARESGEEPV